MNDLSVIKSQLVALEAEIAELRDQQARQLVPPPLPPVMDEPVLLRPGFKVEQISINKVSIAAGYAQTQAGDLTAVSAIASATITGTTHVWARYDRGVVATGPRWEVSAGTIIQTGASLPAFDARYVVIPIAEIAWNGTDSAISGIVQHHVGTLPCPDMEQSGKVQPFNVARGTTIYGWKPCDGTNSTVDVRKKFISGMGASDDLDAGALTTTLTDAALNGISAPHSHSLDYVDTVSVQPFDAGLGGDPIGIDRVGPNTEAAPAAFSGSTSLPIIPSNVPLPHYEHL